jgi:hypothetical protein
LTQASVNAAIEIDFSPRALVAGHLNSRITAALYRPHARSSPSIIVMVWSDAAGVYTMQKDPPPRNTEAQKAKRARELPTSTLWLREEADTMSTQSEPAGTEDNAQAPLTAPEAIEAAPASVSTSESIATPAKADGVPDVQEMQQQAPTHATAQGQPDADKSANGPARDALGVDTQDDRPPEAVTSTAAMARDSSEVDTKMARPNVTKSATAVARDESGFYAWPAADSETASAWPSAAFKKVSSEQSLVMPLLAAAAVTGLLLAAWNYAALGSARSQISNLTQEKAAVESSLADAQGRLAAAEKAIADVKSALATPVGAKAKAPTTAKP